MRKLRWAMVTPVSEMGRGLAAAGIVHFLNLMLEHQTLQLPLVRMEIPTNS